MAAVDGDAVDRGGVNWAAFDDLDQTRPGLVAAVVRSGSIDAWASFGAVEPGGAGLDASSPFYVASIAKQFTAASIALLVHDGVVGLEDPVRRWLPELGSSWAQVRLHHLVEHAAGLADSNELDRRAGFTVDSRSTTAQRAAAIAGSTVESQPGAVHRYSNHGYVLLAEIVERATGERLGDFARRRIFEPLAMSGTGFLDVGGGPQSVPGWADGVRRVTVGFTCVGDGGLVTTMADLARWDRWLPSSPVAPLMLGDRPLMSDGRVAHDAWGISVRSHHGVRIESHGGSIDGYLSSCVRFPAQGVSVIVLANTDEYGIEGFGARIHRFADALLDGRLDLAEPPWTETHGRPVQG